MTGDPLDKPHVHSNEHDDVIELRDGVYARRFPDGVVKIHNDAGTGIPLRPEEADRLAALIRGDSDAR